MGKAQGVGASLLRKEDARFLHGRGEFVADLRLAGTRDVAFVRSPLAHAQLRGVTAPAGAEARVFAARDLEGVQPIVARSGLPGFKVSEQPVLADDRIRYVGELVAACVGATRADAEDLAVYPASGVELQGVEQTGMQFVHLGAGAQLIPDLDDHVADAEVLANGRGPVSPAL